MTTKQIDYCIELAHTLNFSRAAENTFVSQPNFLIQASTLLRTKTIPWLKITSSRMRIFTDEHLWWVVALRTHYAPSSKNSSPPVRSNTSTAPIMTPPM